MAVIGLTGGIGSGKSAVSGYLQQQGYRIIDADQIAREIVLPGSPVLTQLAAHFGTEIITASGALDRRLLAQKAFVNEQTKAMLDRLTHGAIMEIIRSQLPLKDGEQVIFLDAPLLLETGLDQLCDAVWVVDAETDLRINRVVARDGISEAEVRDRMRQQMPATEKKQRASQVLDNNGTLEALYQACDRLLQDFAKG